MHESADGLLSASCLARNAGMPEPTVSKVLKILARHDLIASVRGPAGGYKLARPAADITVAEIVTAVDGPISLTACVHKAEEHCDYASHCVVNGRWDEVNLAIQSALEDVTLGDMMRKDKTLGQRPEERQLQ